MGKLNAFVKTTILGGLVVILPVAILMFTFTWLFGLVTDLIQPLTDLLFGESFLREYPYLAHAIVILIILAACFVVGVFVRTKAGTLIVRVLENAILRRAPGYSLIKETIVQIFGKGASPFSRVALVQVFGNDTLVTAFVTDEHADGSYTIFMPTGPNPTSGNVYHLKGEYVHPIDVPVEVAMRSIISCGAGSTQLVEAYINRAGK